MKVTLERGILLKALSHVQSVVERRNTIQILSNVKLEAFEDKLKLSATDLDLEVVEIIPARVDHAGITTAPALMMHEIVRKLPEGCDVTLDLGGDDPRLRLLSGRSDFYLTVLPQEDFPVMAPGELTHRFALPGPDLKRLFDKARFAVSTEETRYYLNGVYLHTIEADGFTMLRAVATDGHRLARLEMPAPDGADGMPGVIVPRKTVGEVVRLIGESEETVSVAVSSTKIVFTFDELTLTSKLIDGTFPDYERVIPAGNDRIMAVEGRTFTQAVDRVSSISLEKTRAVKLTIDDGMLKLVVSNPESGNAQEELAVSYDAGPLEIGFNARYLLDITGQVDGEEAVFAMSDPGAPTVIEDKADPHALYVLMPMRV
ncbi:MAG: DNA polymerase III subunit beta [Pseudomonadota bacterium]